MKRHGSKQALKRHKWKQAWLVIIKVYWADMTWFIEKSCVFCSKLRVNHTWASNMTRKRWQGKPLEPWAKLIKIENLARYKFCLSNKLCLMNTHLARISLICLLFPIKHICLYSYFSQTQLISKNPFMCSKIYFITWCDKYWFYEIKIKRIIFNRLSFLASWILK